MSYDKKCHGLAIAFLRDYSYVSIEQRQLREAELAQIIQNVIEDYLENEAGEPVGAKNWHGHRRAWAGGDARWALSAAPKESDDKA